MSMSIRNARTGAMLALRAVGWMLLTFITLSTLRVVWARDDAPAPRPQRASTAPPAPVIVRPLFVVELLDSLSVGQSGSDRYAARAATMEGQRYEQSVVTEVEPRHADGVATLTLLLGESFDLLRATVGRDDRDVMQGAGGVYCEVWGDDRLLYKSPVLLSRKRPTQVGGSPQNVRLSPAEIEVSLKGVSLLRLITRYASDVPQRGMNAGRAHGCVWGDLRLMPREGARALRTFDPVRDAVRTAAVRVTAAVIAARNAESNDSAARPPLRVGIAPLQAEGDVIDEAAVRSALLSLLASAHDGNGAIFSALSRRDEEKLTGGVAAANAPDATLSEAGRRAGADVVLAGELAASKEGRLELRAVDVRTGKRLASTTVALVFPGT
jgi:hypothetical protein